jgi:uncharacterized membrane protein
MFTFLSGITIIVLKVVQGGPGVMSTSWGVEISAGALFGILMFLNVWGVIWPKQQVVIASLDAVAAGGQADPAAGPAGARAFLASRTNTLFSIPMLFFMGAASHLPILPAGGKGHVPLAIVTVLALAIEANALYGKKNEGPSKMLESHVGVIHYGLGLALVCYLLFELLT